MVLVYNGPVDVIVGDVKNVSDNREKCSSYLQPMYLDKSCVLDVQETAELMKSLSSGMLRGLVVRGYLKVYESREDYNNSRKDALMTIKSTVNDATDKSIELISKSEDISELKGQVKVLSDAMFLLQDSLKSLIDSTASQNVKRKKAVKKTKPKKGK